MRSGRGPGARCAAGLALTALVALGASAGAQTDDENARRHFESGAAYLQQSDYDNALREFQGAWALSKRPTLLLNIATVYERMGKLREAVDSLETYLKAVPPPKDGEPAERGATDRGTVEVRIVNLKKRIDAERPPPPVASSSAAPAAPAAPPAPAAAPARTVAWIAFGVAGASAAGAVVTGVVAKGKYDDAKSTCAPSCDDATVSSVKSAALVSDLFAGAAVVGAGIGTWLWLRATPSRTGAVPVVVAAPSKDGGKLEATWRF